MKSLHERAMEYTDRQYRKMQSPPSAGSPFSSIDLDLAWKAGYRAAQRDARQQSRRGKGAKK